MLVTGGNRGIGRAIAQSFADAGDNVAITYRSGEPPAGILAVKMRHHRPRRSRGGVYRDRGCPGSRRGAVANAGVTRNTLLLRMSEDDWTTVIETNLTGTFRTVKRASKGMLRLRRGRIILISSVVGLLGSAGQVNYAASKSGLVGMARSIARYCVV